jgi:ubiquinol-cytochrome c reductase cytochrome c subunit
MVAPSRSWRVPLLSTAVVLAASGVLLWLLQRPADGQVDLVAKGRELFGTGCSSCHGPNGEGVTTPDGRERGPSLTDSGEAAAYYALSTGRMPLADPEAQAVRKRPAYDAADIDALVAYVGSLGNGPTLPRVDVSSVDLADGGELFRANCAPCHSASGAGGALSYGRAAPKLAQATPLEVAAAVRAGPGQMPVFGPDTLTDREVSDIAGYVHYLQDPDDRGGIPIGRTGPVPEGFVAWFFGMGALVALVMWIGTRSPVRAAAAAKLADTDGDAGGDDDGEVPR